MTAGACPSLADLLLALEGALPPVAQAEVSTHLRQCATCQSTLATAQSTLAAAAGLMRDVVRQVMKPFAERDMDEGAEARFQRFVAVLDARKLRLQRRPASPFRRWLPLAATFILVALLVFEPHSTVIEADELVKHAVSAEHVQLTGLAQRVRLTETPANAIASDSLDENLSDGIVARLTSVPVTGTPETLARRRALQARITQRLAAHQFDARQPFSLDHFIAWRSSLHTRRDEVIDQHGSPFITLHTSTRDTGLREVELRLWRDSYLVAREEFRFADGSAITYEEMTRWQTQTAPITTETADNASTVPDRTARPAEPLAPAYTAPQPDLARWRDRRFGNTEQYATFMPGLRRMTDAVRQHLAALRDLSTRYPGSDGPDSPAARARFQRQRDLQYQTLRDDLESLRPSITNLTLQLQGSQGIAAPAGKQLFVPADWAHRVSDGLGYASTLDRLADDLRGYDDLPDALQQRIADAFGALCATIYAPAPEMQ